MAEPNALHEALIENFSTVTGASRERARFYLQAAGWDFPVSECGNFGLSKFELYTFFFHVSLSSPPPSLHSFLLPCS